MMAIKTLFDLPSEVRIMIYEHFFRNTEVRVYKTFRLPHLVGLWMQFKNNSNRHFLLASKASYNDSIETFYRVCKVHISRLDLTDVTAAIDTAVRSTPSAPRLPQQQNRQVASEKKPVGMTEVLTALRRTPQYKDLDMFAGRSAVFPKAWITFEFGFDCLTAEDDSAGVVEQMRWYCNYDARRNKLYLKMG